LVGDSYVHPVWCISTHFLATSETGRSLSLPSYFMIFSAAEK